MISTLEFDGANSNSKSAEVRIEFEAGEEIYRRYTAVSPITIDDLS